MMHWIFSIFFLFLTIFSQEVSSSTIRPNPAQEEAFSKLINEYEKHHEIPCFVAGHIQKYDDGHYERVLQSSGYFSDIENHVTCTKEVMLRVASVSKAMGSILTAKYVENGSLSWDEDIHKWMPEKYFPHKTWNGKQVKTTLRQLTMHQSGIRGTRSEDVKHYWEPRILNTTGALVMFAEDPLEAEPETKFIYSNNGINLIAAVIEQVQKRSYHELAREFFRGFGMKYAQMDSYQELIPHRGGQYSGVHHKDGKFEIRKAPIDDNLRPFPHWPAGGVISNIEDLLIFSQNVIDIYDGKSKFLKAETLKHMWNHETMVSSGKVSMTVNRQVIHDIKSHYVMGWGRYDFPFVDKMHILSNLTIFHHTGAVGSASAIKVIFPDRKFAFDAIANLGGVSQHLIELAVNAYYVLHDESIK